MKTTVGNFFKQIKIIHIALCIGAFFIMIILKYLRFNASVAIIESNLFLYVGLAIAMVAIIFSRVMFINVLKIKAHANSISDKLSSYRNAVIIQMALLEGACITNAIFYFIDGNDKLFGVAIALLFLMIMRRPNRVEAKKVLNITDEASTRALYDDTTEIMLQ